MSDLADFLEGKTRTAVAKCPVARLVDEVRLENETVAEQLESVITSDYPVTRLHANLRKAGYSVARDSLTYHRNALCVCKENTHG